MTRGEAWLTHLATAVAGGTGLVYGWMRYLAEPADEFSIVNHPWQPELKALHILGVPLLVFACGLLWRHHVWARVRSGYPGRRRTGLVLFALLVPMVVSGYGVQVAVAEGWRTAWIWIHGVSSVLWVLGYLVHQLAPRKGRAAPARPS